MNNKQIFSQQLREVMLKNKVSVATLSNELGIHISTIYKYLKCTTNYLLGIP